MPSSPLNLKAAAWAWQSVDQIGRGDADQVLISVSDTGLGLPTGRADEIFNAFFTTKPQGSGMGLAISRSDRTRRCRSSADLGQRHRTRIADRKSGRDLQCLLHH